MVHVGSFRLWSFEYFLLKSISWILNIHHKTFLSFIVFEASLEVKQYAGKTAEISCRIIFVLLTCVNCPTLGIQNCSISISFIFIFLSVNYKSMIKTTIDMISEQNQSKYFYAYFLKVMINECYHKSYYAKIFIVIRKCIELKKNTFIFKYCLSKSQMIF